MHLKQNKGQTKFFQGNEDRILALSTCQVERREMANRKKKGE